MKYFQFESKEKKNKKINKFILISSFLFFFINIKVFIGIYKYKYININIINIL